MSAFGMKIATGIVLAALAGLCLGAPHAASAATYTVNSSADAPDADTADGVCADSAGRCTLRAAIMQANATGGTNTIDLSLINDPDNPIVLTIPGADETAQGSPGQGYEVIATHDASKGDLNITSSMNIVGAGPDKTIIEWAPSARQDPASGDRVFHIEAVSGNIAVSISGVTIANGVTPAPEVLQKQSDGTYYALERSGAGIAIGAAAEVTLVDPAVSGSESGQGGDEGGVGGPGGESGGGEEEGAASITGVTLSDVRILDNASGASGGGIASAAPLTLDRVLVSGNTAAANGGGIYNDAQLTVRDSTIGTMSGFANPNSAEGGGGLFDTGMHTTQIEESTIAGNKAVGGGGISARSMVELDIVNSTIDGNTATDVGGGITANGTVSLRNDTISGNTSANDSAGGGAGLNAFGKGSYAFVNTLFQGNLASGAGSPVSCGCSGSSCKTGVLASGGHNLADDASCALTASGDLANTPVELQPLAANGGSTETRALLKGSPAVDAGDNANCPNGDQRGNLRPADGNLRGTAQCDIGAYELFTDTADLHVSGKRGADKVTRGGPANLSFEFTNDPGATADATGVVVTTDPLPAGYWLSGATFTTAAGTSDCAVNSSTRVVTCEVGTLPRGQTVTLDLQGTGNAIGKLSVTAHISAAAPADVFPENNSTTLTLEVQGTSNVGITAAAPGQQLRVSGQAPLTFSVKNLGPDPATNVRVLAVFATRMRYRTMQLSRDGTCTLQQDQLSALCDCGTVAAGDTFTGTLNLQPTSAGTASVQFEVSTDAVDSDVTNDSATVPLTILEAVPTTPTTPTVSTSGGGGGCVSMPGGPFDPALPALLAAAAVGLAARRGRRRSEARSRQGSR